MPYHILVQGMTPDMSQANGDYDAAYEYQVNTPDELLDVIRRVAPLQDPPHPPEADVCPPNLVVTVGEEQFTFMPDGGNLYCNNVNGYVTPEQALQLITVPGTADMARQAVQQQSGVAPVRMAHIPPTDRENFYHDNLDTGPHQPQVHFAMKRAHNANADVIVWSIIGVLLVGFALLMVGTGAAVPGLIVGTFGALSLWGAKRAAGRMTMAARVGFDWKWNALWSVVGDSGHTGYLLDANLIVDVIGVRRIAPGLGHESFEVFVPGQSKSQSALMRENPWDIRFVDVKGDRLILDSALDFHDVMELHQALNSIRGLFASQQ